MTWSARTWRCLPAYEDRRMPVPFYRNPHPRRVSPHHRILLSIKSPRLSWKWHAPMKAMGSSFLRQEIPSMHLRVFTMGSAGCISACHRGCSLLKVLLHARLPVHPRYSRHHAGQNLKRSRAAMHTCWRLPVPQSYVPRIRLQEAMILPGEFSLLLRFTARQGDQLLKSGASRRSPCLFQLRARLARCRRCCRTLPDYIKPGYLLCLMMRIDLSCSVFKKKPSHHEFIS